MKRQYRGLQQGTTIFSLLSFFSLSVMAIALAAPAHAQYTTVSAAPLDQFADNHGQFASSYEGNTGTQTLQFLDAIAPRLQGATHGTIGPQGADATYITGVNTAGTVRVNNLANLEALLNIIANGMEILGIAWGGPTLIYGFMKMAAGTKDSVKSIIHGCCGITGGLATPGLINWLVASARDANLFS
jgi:hypothetical protein